MFWDDKKFTEMWNCEYCRLLIARPEGDTNHVNSGMADYCERLIIKAKELYYSSGSTLMSDMNYDKLEDRLRDLRPDSDVLEKVG